MSLRRSHSAMGFDMMRLMRGGSLPKTGGLLQDDERMLPMPDEQSPDDRPPETEKEFLAWDLGPQEGPCPWCGAVEVPAPEVGKGATKREHSDDCPFVAWYMKEA